MKVFISWSGTKSHRVAMVFREWLPSVIQSIEPYVSSEDIDKGARWSTDIATELEDSNFGILCVTKENINAPWISFEAGALSKTMDKAYVTPFLFDIKRSEVDGPILQFQSTIFEREDIKKLVITLNKACVGNNLSDSMLEKAFEVWYPKLESDLNQLQDIKEESDATENSDVEAHLSSILEEVLDLSRENQKLIRNPDAKLVSGIEEMNTKLERLVSRLEGRRLDPDDRRIRSRQKEAYLRDIYSIVMRQNNLQYALLMMLDLVRDDYPWLLYAGKSMLDMLNSRASKEKKSMTLSQFAELCEKTFDSYPSDYSYSRGVHREAVRSIFEICMRLRDENI